MSILCPDQYFGLLNSARCMQTIAFPIVSAARNQLGPVSILFMLRMVYAVFNICSGYIFCKFSNRCTEELALMGHGRPAQGSLFKRPSPAQLLGPTDTADEV